MTRSYAIETPEQLRELNKFAKEGSAANLASMWSATRRKDGKAPWDNKMFALFDTSTGRKAYIARALGEGMTLNVTLKYSPALKWCEENLKPGTPHR